MKTKMASLEANKYHKAMINGILSLKQIKLANKNTLIRLRNKAHCILNSHKGTNTSAFLFQSVTTQVDDGAQQRA